MLLCDSQIVTRIGLEAVLDAHPAVDLVGSVHSGVEATAAVDTLNPDVVLSDVNFPDLDGVELTRRLIGGATGTELAEARRAVRVLLMVSDTDDRVLEGIRAGVSGVLMKTGDAEEFLRAIAVVRDGGNFLSAQVVPYIFERVSRRPVTPTGDVVLRSLTNREREVLALLGHGLSNSEISERIYVGDSTVKYHVSQLLRKLRLRDRLQAAAFAYKHGLLER